MSKYPRIIVADSSRRLVQTGVTTYVFEMIQHAKDAMGHFIGRWVTVDSLDFKEGNFFNHIDNRASNYSLQWLIGKIKMVNK